MKNNKHFLVLLLLALTTTFSIAQDNNYNIGVGISDVTGQIAETNFFGYGNPFFSNTGMRDRQYARAYIIEEAGSKPVLYVCIDKGAVFQSVNVAVLDKLKAMYGDLYQDENVVITATHTHVSPAGYSYYNLYDVSVGGFYQENFDILVSGIVDAAKQAHESKSPGRIYYNTGDLYNASINRSLVAYNLNKDAADYPSIDPEMTVLKFVQGDKEVGMISFFAVHPTNLNNKYKLASGDNKGYASLKFERFKQSSYGQGDNTFVASFSNTNPGDMSPNLILPPAGDYRTEAVGPGKDVEESSEILGERQYQKALELYNNATNQVRGSVKFVSRYTDMSNVEVEPQFTDGEYQHTCIAAYGTSFRAGAEDGRSGIGKEGETRYDIYKDIALDKCHAEKRVDPLFILGKNEDNPRSPKILGTSIVKIGQLGFLTAPAEFTIMSSRRVKATVSKYDLGFDHLVFVGFSDAYAGYVTTREEYASQQYEGASVHFGPWTLGAYRQIFDRLAQKLLDPESNPWQEAEAQVPNMSPSTKDKTPTIYFDDKPWFADFGDVLNDANYSYTNGDKVQVTFWGAHPNNDAKTNSTYLEVQRKTNDGWKTVYTDRDVSTKLVWERNGVARSLIIIDWKISDEDAGGKYRIVHYGTWKNGWTGKLSPYTGVSRSFYVNPRPQFLASPKKEVVESDISIFPSVTSGPISIVNPSKSVYTYEVSNYLGQVVATDNVQPKNTTQVDLNGNNGMYFVVVKEAGNIVHQAKIIKQ